jgi:hypothetical protein
MRLVDGFFGHRRSHSEASWGRIVETIWGVTSLVYVSVLGLWWASHPRYVMIDSSTARICSQARQLFCITADNTSNNDTTCATIETILHRRKIYSFDPVQHRLPCLAHVVNLGVVAVMSMITRIANVETSTAIWEFDPTDPNNRVLGNSLDVVAAVRTIAIKVRSLLYICYCKG